ncbi:hypothetical protein OS493_030209 [Desmophyllum pertusum]|uniref:Uncharacterized protein n=1 Tax=Desmophyllum pertusum TaxID=174260 RepID=A0A9X0CI46_9CNID|nr:hypothetical protein OS493_030209 [Desmophyllum pertusum]
MEAMRGEVLKDHLRERTENKEKGVVDSLSHDEFLAKVIAASDKWDDRERSIHPIQIKGTRSQMQDAIGYRPNLKCTWVEAIKLYKNMLEEVNREKQRVVLGKGPYVLSRKYSHLEVPLLKWTKMTHKQKQNHLAKVSCKKAGQVDPAVVDLAVDPAVVDLAVDPAVVDLAVYPPDDAEANATGIAAVSSDKIGNFDEYNFPEFLRGHGPMQTKLFG